tara:strand:- start:280 stop:1437 length:1158 start_codon:yes stop_codon:yes gene_type:complete
MLNKSIKFQNFLFKKNTSSKKKILKLFNDLVKSNSQILSSMSVNYKDTYTKKLILGLKKTPNIDLVGMGGSVLGAKAIYKFLRNQKKKFNFIDNFSNHRPIKKGKYINLIISKSGNTLETISNLNTLINKKKKNIFITENKKSYLTNLAKKYKSQIIYHNNYIGGRYSVLSEVGMLPAELMGYKPKKFRRFNSLIKNKKFVNQLINNVSSIFEFIKSNKNNSIILNYDEKSDHFFKWYQQLTAESLGKKNKGILPIVSSMPRDNHSLMQYYLDGVKNSFFTLFFVKETNTKKIKNKEILSSHYYLKNKSLNDIAFSQFLATANVFKKKKIPFRSFIIKKRDEETLGELFIYFILETILLAKLMKIDPYNQPAVELIKKETKKRLI